LHWPAYRNALPLRPVPVPIIRFLGTERWKRQHNFFQELPVCVQQKVSDLIEFGADLVTNSLDLTLQPSD
jgi:hypothetical protein